MLRSTTRLLLRAGLALACGWMCLAEEVRQDNTYVRLSISEGNDVVFVPVSFGQGPSHGRIGHIVQDHTGFLWFGTKDGLKRYDGYRFRDFRANPKDPGSMNGVFINALFADRSGQLWVAPDERLDRYDPLTETFAHFVGQPGKLEPPVNDISQDHDGMIWFATSHGLTRLDPATGDMTRFQHKSNDPSSLTNDSLRSTFEEQDGTFWVACNVALDLFDRRSGLVKQHYSLSNPLLAGVRNSANPSVRLFEDRAGVLWVASARDGLAMVDRQGKKLVFIALYPGAGPRTQPGAYAIHEDPQGVLWVGTNGGGLLKLDRDRKRIVRYRNHPSDPDSLSSDQVLTLFGDHEGGIWVGTGGGGVLRIPSQVLPFQRYRHEPGNLRSLPSDYVSSVFEDSHGLVWVGTSGEATRIDKQTGQYTRFKLASAKPMRILLRLLKTARASYGSVRGAKG